MVLFHDHHLFCSWPPINCSTPKLSRSPPSRTIWVSKCYMVVKGNFNIKKMNSVILFLFSSLFPILLRLIFSIQFFILPCNLEAEWPIMIKKIVFRFNYLHISLLYLSDLAYFSQKKKMYLQSFC